MIGWDYREARIVSRSADSDNGRGAQEQYEAHYSAENSANPAVRVFVIDNTPDTRR